MDQDSKILTVKFPIANPNSFDGQDLVLRSCDVVGVGGVRRAQLQVLILKNRVTLLNQFGYLPESLRPFYELELLKTLSWIRPAQTQIATLDFLAEQKDLFPRIFPQTTLLLGDMAFRQRDLYLQQVDVGSWLLQEHWRYFVGFLRKQFPQQKKILQVAHWEWVYSWLEVQALSESTSESEFLRPSSTLQTLILDIEAAEILNFKPGLYALWFDETQGQIKEFCLSAEHAVLLDLLQEDRKYRSNQIVEMARLQAGSNINIRPEEWEKAFLTLKSQGIIKGGSE